jgi:hypothetical protein
MSCGIAVRVQRDGLFMFDFTGFEPATYVQIPRYEVPVGKAFIQPSDVWEAENKAEDIAVFRAQIINAFQACLETAGAQHGSGSGLMGEPVTVKETYKTIDVDWTPDYSLDVRYPNQFVRSIANGAVGTLTKAVFPPRRVYNIASIEAAIALLDKILANDAKFAVSIVEGAYVAAIRCSEKRFGESIVLGWSVCERLINSRFEHLVARVESDRGVNIPSERKKKLRGRDYTASVVTEFLELFSDIDGELYKRLDTARKARNAWAHNLEQPTIRQVDACLRATWQLIEDAFALKLFFQPFPQGGVPQWSLAMLEEVWQRKAAETQS